MIRLAAFLVFCGGGALVQMVVCTRGRHGDQLAGLAGRGDDQPAHRGSGAWAWGVVFAVQANRNLLSWPSWLGHNWRACRRRRVNTRLVRGWWPLPQGI